jgi:hypothetical protein
MFHVEPLPQRHPVAPPGPSVLMARRGRTAHSGLTTRQGKQPALSQAQACRWPYTQPHPLLRHATELHIAACQLQGLMLSDPVLIHPQALRTRSRRISLSGLSASLILHAESKVPARSTLFPPPSHVRRMCMERPHARSIAGSLTPQDLGQGSATPPEQSVPRATLPVRRPCDGKCAELLRGQPKYLLSDKPRAG